MAANPPDGAILDYFLPSTAAKVSLDILDGQGKVVRSFSSADKPSISQEDLQKQLIPLYWVRPSSQLSTDAGMHRWVWDLHENPPISNRHDYPIAAVPHDTPRYPLGPTVLPGTYTIKLTVDGKSLSAPLTIKMDPRIKISSAELQKKFEAETQMASAITESTTALLQGGAIREHLEKLQGLDYSGKVDVEPYQKKLGAVIGGQGGFGAPPSTDVTLSRVSGEASTLYQEVWSSEAAPTAAQAEAIAAAGQESTEALKRWNEFKNTDLPELNRKLRGAKVPEIKIESDPPHDELEGDEE